MTENLTQKLKEDLISVVNRPKELSGMESGETLRKIYENDINLSSSKKKNKEIIEGLRGRIVQSAKRKLDYAWKILTEGNESPIEFEGKEFITRYNKPEDKESVKDIVEFVGQKYIGEYIPIADKLLKQYE